MAAKTEKFQEDWPLMQLYRQYSKEEGMAQLFKEISELKVKIGILTSENAELEHTVKTLSNISTSVTTLKSITKSEKKFLKQQWGKDEYIAELMERLHSKGMELAEANKKCTQWRDKYFSLQVRTEKQTV